jgi:hypothetical protein
MLSLRDMFRGHEAPEAPMEAERERLPAELVQAIENASVTFRAGGDPEFPGAEVAMPVVKIIGLGSWRFDGINDAADRIQRRYPELSRQACRRAAKLVSRQVGARNRADFRREPRRSWVMDW